MLRILIPFALLAIFLGWLLYRMLVKKDIKKHLNELYFGVFFFGVWAAIYFLIIKS